MSNFLLDLINSFGVLSKTTSLDEIAANVFTSFGCYLPYNSVGIALIDKTSDVYALSIYTDLELLHGKEYIEKTLTKAVASVLLDKAYKIGRRSNGTIIRSYIAYPLLSGDNVIGVIQFASLKPNVYNTTHLNYVKMIANNMMAIIEKNNFMDDLVLASIVAFTELIEARDMDTGLHIKRIQMYSKILTKGIMEMGEYRDTITEQYIEDIYKYSPLHDIGKIGIADAILLKPTKLTTDEFEAMKKHPVIGAYILRKTRTSLLKYNRNMFDMGIEIAESHHEKYNGTGYPYGISGKNIPLSARIVAVADVFDALTSKRVYKNAYDISTSIKTIEDGDGESFDPIVVKAFLNNKKKIISVLKSYQEESIEGSEEI